MVPLTVTDGSWHQVTASVPTNATSVDGVP